MQERDCLVHFLRLLAVCRSTSLLRFFCGLVYNLFNRHSESRGTYVVAQLLVGL